MKHGGDLAAAEMEFGLPREQWLDLSTGINPHPYPLPPFAPESLTRLPEAADVQDLLRLARAAYGWAENVPAVAGPGSQAFIQLLPYLRERGPVAVLGPTYAEHAYMWARAGHQVREIRSVAQIEDAINIVIVNPNNPNGRIASPTALARVASELAPKGGLLVVDEAFADVSPEAAMGPLLGSKGVVVLRSFGKFFGLAGIRLGFAAGDAETIGELAGELGPWPISGPALEAGTRALADEGWMAAMRLQLSVEGLRLDLALAGAGLTVAGGTDLFRMVRTPQAAELHATLARMGVWVRRFDERPDQLRFGLPPDEAGFARLESVLKAAL